MIIQLTTFMSGRWDDRLIASDLDVVAVGEVLPVVPNTMPVGAPA